MNKLFVHWPTTSIRLGYTFILMRQHHKTQYRISKRFHAFICCFFFGLFFVSSNQLSIYHCYHQRTRFREINEFLYAIHIWANFYLFFCSFLCFLLQLYRFFMCMFKLKKKITYNLFAHCIVKYLFSNIRNFIVFIQSNLHVLNDDDAVRSEGVQCTPKIVCNLQKMHNANTFAGR